MASARIQKLNLLLKRVEERSAQPRLLAVSPALSAPKAAPANTVAPLLSSPAARASVPDSDLFAATIPPAAPSLPPQSATVPPAATSADAARRAPSSSPLEDAMALLGNEREDSGPLRVEALSTPIQAPQAPARPSLPDAQWRAHQDAMLTHRPEAGPSAPPAPLVELVAAKVPGPALREPTIEFDTGVKANPLTQRDLKPIGLMPEARAPAPEPALPAEAPPTGPTHTLEPAPMPAHAAPARVVSQAQRESEKSFGELLELSLALRPSEASGTTR